MVHIASGVMLTAVALLGMAVPIGEFRLAPHAVPFAAPSMASGAAVQDPVADGPGPAESELLALMNRSRASVSARELAWDTRAASAAWAHAQDMVETRFFDSTDAAGRGPIERLRESEAAFTHWAENLSLTSSVAASHTADMRTSPYRENILDPRFDRVGIGIVTRPDGMLIIVVLFLSP